MEPRDAAAKLVTGRALSPTKRPGLQRFDSAEEMLSKHHHEPKSPAEAVLLERAIRGSPQQKKLQRFDSATELVGADVSPPITAADDPELAEWLHKFSHPKQSPTASPYATPPLSPSPVVATPRGISVVQTSGIIDDAVVSGRSSFSEEEEEEEEEEEAPNVDGAAAWSWVAVAVAVLVRYAVSLHPYSGEGTGPRFGDYEAHRHWMEVTTHLPLGAWYSYDVAYWGLDYPPLMAYLEYGLGLVSKALEPAATAFEVSRGYESRTHRAWMRATVLACDALVACSAVVALAHRLHKKEPSSSSSSSSEASSPPGLVEVTKRRGAAVALALLAPAAILVDHGHFQYNCLPLGLTLWAAVLVDVDRRVVLLPLSAALAYSLALNAKQTALYYAPAVFFELLARALLVAEDPPQTRRLLGGGRGVFSFPPPTTTTRTRREEEEEKHPPRGGRRRRGYSSLAPWRVALGRVAALGLVVVFVFGVLWAPLVWHGVAFQALRRCFPFERGVFEDKVANGWYVAQVVLRVRDRLEAATLVKLASAATFSTAVLPGALRLGLMATGRLAPSLRGFLWSLHATALAFFLCSYHVHEKSILVPLAPLGLLALDAPNYVLASNVAAAVTLAPLLAFEGLHLPYALTALIYLLTYAAIVVVPPPWASTNRLRLLATATALAALHVLPVLAPPPARFPDLYPALTALAGAAFFGLAWPLATRAALTHGGTSPPPKATATTTATTTRPKKCD